MSVAGDLRPDFSIALLVDLEITTACIKMMLVYPALELPVHKEPSDSKEAQPLQDAWKSATTMSGAQCVMTSLTPLMHK